MLRHRFRRSYQGYFEKKCTSILLISNFVEGVLLLCQPSRRSALLFNELSIFEEGCASAQRDSEKRCTSALRVIYIYIYCTKALLLRCRSSRRSTLLRCVLLFFRKCNSSALRVFEKECASILRVTKLQKGVLLRCQSSRGSFFCLTGYSSLKKGCTSAQRVVEKRCTSALRGTSFAEGLYFCYAGLREAVHSCAASRSF